MAEIDETSLWHVPLSETVVRRMYTLACTPFELSAFQQKWRQFGWSYTPDPTDEFGFQVQIDQELHLNIALNGSQVDCAILPFCYWEEYEEEDHDTKAAYRKEKRSYDQVYQDAFSKIEQTLGPPYAKGQDADDQAHRHAVWRGNTAWLILQQAAFDVQFGLEVDLWLEPGVETEFTPTSPLIDWLNSQRSPSG